MFNQAARSQPECAAMQEFLTSLLRDLAEETLGVIGGLFFFLSWVLQAWESKRVGQSVVSARFFWMRAIACVFLALEGWRTGSISLTLVMVATFAMVLYNLRLIAKSKTN